MRTRPEHLARHQSAVLQSSRGRLRLLSVGRGRRGRSCGSVHAADASAVRRPAGAPLLDVRSPAPYAIWPTSPTSWGSPVPTSLARSASRATSTRRWPRCRWRTRIATTPARSCRGSALSCCPRRPHWRHRPGARRRRRRRSVAAGRGTAAPATGARSATTTTSATTSTGWCSATAWSTPAPTGPGPTTRAYTLDDAQRDKLDLVCRKLGLHEGGGHAHAGRRLRLGLLAAARRLDATASAGSASPSRRAGRAGPRAGRSSRPRATAWRSACRTTATSTTARSTRSSSIGMAEHVGDAGLRRVRRRTLLSPARPGGRLLNHQIARQPGPTKAGTSFIDALRLPRR